MIRRNVIGPAHVVTLDGADYEAVIDRMTQLGLSSGAVYDALHVRAAEKVPVDRLYTFNGRDFRRMPPAPPTELIVL